MVATGISLVRRDLDRKPRGKLRNLLLDAAANVPMYRSLYGSLALSGDDFADAEVLDKLPVLSKAALLATPAEARRSSRFALDELSRETTTGSTGQPMALYVERRYKLLRNLRFLHALLAVGYRPWQRLMLLTDRHAGLSRRYNWRYVSVEQPTANLAAAYLETRPHVLYGFTTPLRLLARELSARRQGFPRPRLVVSTAEMLDGATRRALESAFDCQVADFYGMTEMGLVAWQRPGADRYVMFNNAVLTELLPDPGCPGRHRMIMTNLDLLASPVIRFDSGDLAHARQIDGELRITAFEGRVIDTLKCRDGSELSPYRVTDALRDIPGVRRFKVTQLELAQLDVQLDVSAALQAMAVERVRHVLGNLLGSGLELSFRFSGSVIPEGSRKFRPVESLVVRP